MAENGLRGGGWLLPNSIFNIIAVLNLNIVEEGEATQEAYDLQAIMYDPKVHYINSDFRTLLLAKEGCTSVDETYWLYGPYARVTVDYFDKMAKKHLIIKLKGYKLYRCPT